MRSISDNLGEISASLFRNKSEISLFVIYET